MDGIEVEISHQDTDDEIIDKEESIHQEHTDISHEIVDEEETICQEFSDISHQYDNVSCTDDKIISEEETTHQEFSSISQQDSDSYVTPIINNVTDIAKLVDRACKEMEISVKDQRVSPLSDMLSNL